MSFNLHGFRMFLAGISFLLLSAGILGCHNNGGDGPIGKTVSVTGVDLDKSSVTLLINDTLQLNATIAPVDATNKGVTWSSSDATKASVSGGGLITALAVGNTTISVTTKDGGKQAQCDVKVEVAPWTSLLGAAGKTTYGTDIAIDSDGNSYVIGRTSGAIDGQELNGTSDAFIMKYNAAGDRLWTRLMGGAGAVLNGEGIAVDTDGNCYVTGNTNGTVYGQAKTGFSDVFVMKYDTEGNRLWTRLMGALGSNTGGKSIAVDSAGNCYVTGQTSGALDGQTLTGLTDVFATKYDTDGTRQWTRLLGANNTDTYGEGIAAAAGGTCYVTGYTYGGLDGQAMTGAGDAFVLKYDADGVRQWTKLMGATGAYTIGCGIALDDGGNFYIVGHTTGDPDGQTKTGDYDIMVMKYSAAGNRQWTRLMGAAGVRTYGLGIAVTEGGTLYVTGHTGGDLDGQTKTGMLDALAIKYDTTGTRQWTRLMGVADKITVGYGIAVNSDGTSFVAGYTEGPLDGQTLNGTMDVFVTTRLNPQID